MATSTSPNAPVDINSLKNLDADDASRLSYLTYAQKHYAGKFDVQSMIDALKTSDAKDIAKAIVGRKPKNKLSQSVAQVYLDWIDHNS